MKSKSQYRQIAAFLLSLLVLQTVVLKELHLLFDGHHLVAVAHCDDAKNGVAHIHGEEYAPVDCSVCFFNFAPATLDFPYFSIATPSVQTAKNCFFYKNDLSQRLNWHFLLRGPPALAA